MFFRYVLITASLALPSLLPATLVTFDDEPAGPVPRPYHELIFSSSPGVVMTPNFVSAVVSGPNALLTDGQPMGIYPVNWNIGATFIANSAYFTAAAEDTLIVDLLGRRDGYEMFSRTFQVTRFAPTFVSFDPIAIDELTFNARYNDPYGYTHRRLLIDNLSVNASTPEPGTVGLLASGLLLMLARRNAVR